MQPMFFPPAQKYTLIKNVSGQLALVCETKSSALLWRGKGIPVTEEFIVNHLRSTRMLQGLGLFVHVANKNHLEYDSSKFSSQKTETK